MKRCLYIDHFYHQKTKSTNFLLNKLKEVYQVDCIYITKHDDDNELLYTSARNNFYDLVVCFQLLPNRDCLDSQIYYAQGIIIPMYDGMLPFDHPLWAKYRDFKILNFSKTLHHSFKRHGFNSNYIQYCPSLKPISNLGRETSAFFWQRTDNLTLNLVLKLIKTDQIKEIHVHTAVDPHQKPVKIPHVRKLRISTSRWFEDKRDLEKLIEKSAIYFAPRLYEGIGQSFLEAMAMGRCVIAPDTPTANEYICHNETGLLYNPKKITKLDLSNVRNIQMQCQKAMIQKRKNYIEEIGPVIQWLGRQNEITLNLVVDSKILLNYSIPGAARTGIFMVALNIVQELNKIPSVNLGFYVNKAEIDDLKNNISLIFGHSNFDFYTDDSDWSRCQAFLSPLYKIPNVIKNNKYILKYTILYDCIPIIFKKGYGENQPWWFEMFEEMCNDEHYFSISSYTKSDFLKYKSNLRPSDITVIPLGVNGYFKNSVNPSQLSLCKKKFGIPENASYIISVCSLEPRKNLQTAISSFVEFLKKYKIDDLYFVLVGHRWENFTLNIEDLYKKKIICTGYVDDLDIPKLYKGALFSVFTSKFEGFGLPVLESMSIGVPVVTSNNTSMPEVAENAGYYVDPNSISDHVEAYRNLYFDNAHRNKLGELGLSLAKKWGWDKAADAIYQKIKYDEVARFPRVTIVTATFNLIKSNRKLQFLRCVNSVYNQSYPGEIEHLVIDGGSDDGTIELINELKLKKKITNFITEPDEGVYDAMNKGIKLATGQYIAFLNSDDYYHDKSGLYWTIRQLLISNADYSYADAIVTDLISNKSTIWKGDITNIPYASHFCHQTMFVKTSVMRELNGFDLSYKVSSDSDLCIRAVKRKYKAIYNPWVFVTYFIGEGLSSVNSNQSQMDHAMSFYRHFCGNKITLQDCLNLWQCKGFSSFTKEDVNRIRTCFNGTIFESKFISLTAKRKNFFSRMWKSLKEWKKNKLRKLKMKAFKISS